MQRIKRYLDASMVPKSRRGPLSGRIIREILFSRSKALCRDPERRESSCLFLQQIRMRAYPYAAQKNLKGQHKLCSHFLHNAHFTGAALRLRAQGRAIYMAGKSPLIWFQ